MNDMIEIEGIIAAHKRARVEHDRLFALNDHGLVPDSEVSAALDPIDQALLRLCSVRPSSDEARLRRRDYLLPELIEATGGVDGMTRAAFGALLC